MTATPTEPDIQAVLCIASPDNADSLDTLRENAKAIGVEVVEKNGTCVEGPFDSIHDQRRFIEVGLAGFSRAQGRWRAVFCDDCDDRQRSAVLGQVLSWAAEYGSNPPGWLMGDPLWESSKWGSYAVLAVVVDAEQAAAS